MNFCLGLIVKFYGHVQECANIFKNNILLFFINVRVFSGCFCATISGTFT